MNLILILSMLSNTSVGESYVVYQDNKCQFWMYSSEPMKRNPCGIDEQYVPGNATLLDLTDMGLTNESH